MTISILGCGWVGLPLGTSLVRRGYRVKGSTTRAERLSALSDAGIEPFLLRLTPQPEGDLAGFLTGTDVLIISLAPRAAQQGEGHYTEQVRALVGQLPAALKVLFISSTSVYPDLNREVTEEDEPVPTNSIAQAERALDAFAGPVTIVRFGGLLGYDRIPGKYFIGKTVRTGQVPVNFIHRDDAVGVLMTLLAQDRWSETFNAVAPQHPVRRAIYLKNAELGGWAPPQFEEPTVPEPFKIISPAKLIGALNYSFQFPDPLDFTYSS